MNGADASYRWSIGMWTISKVLLKREFHRCGSCQRQPIQTYGDNRIGRPGMDASMDWRCGRIALARQNSSALPSLDREVILVLEIYLISDVARSRSRKTSEEFIFSSIHLNPSEFLRIQLPTDEVRAKRLLQKRQR